MTAGLPYDEGIIRYIVPKDSRYVFFIGLFSIPYMWLIHKYRRETKAFLATRITSVADSSPNDNEQRNPHFTELFSKRLRFKTAMLFFGEFFQIFAYGSTILLTA